MLLEGRKFADAMGLAFLVVIVIFVVGVLGGVLNLEHDGGGLLDAVEHDAAGFGVELAVGHGLEDFADGDLDGVKVLKGRELQSVRLAVAAGLSAAQAASAKVGITKTDKNALKPQ